MKRAILILAAGILLLNCSSDEPETPDSRMVLQKIYDNSGGKGDATAITMEDMKAIGLKNLEDARLKQYQNAIAVKTDFSNPATVGELQAMVMDVNENCDCGCDAAGTTTEIKFDAKIFYKTPSHVNDNYYNNHYWIVHEFYDMIRFRIVCNEELIPEGLKAEIKSLPRGESIEVLISGYNKRICIGKVAIATVNYSRIVLTSIERSILLKKVSYTVEGRVIEFTVSRDTMISHINPNSEPTLVYKDGTKEIPNGRITIKIKPNEILSEILTGITFTSEVNQFNQNKYLIQTNLRVSALFTLVTNLNNDNRVVYAEPTFTKILKIFSSPRILNDTYLDSQWAIKNQRYLGGKVNADMGVD